MANQEHVNLLRQGINQWNQSRWEKKQLKLKPAFKPDSSGADLSETDLSEADLSGADLSGSRIIHANFSSPLRGAHYSRTNLSQANLSYTTLISANLIGANLTGTNLSHAIFSDAILSYALLTSANLSHAIFPSANLTGANLTEANLTEANLTGANLTGANLNKANLIRADLSWSNLSHATIVESNLNHANLSQATLIGTNLNQSILTDCRVYGISVWDLQLKNTIQSNLVITSDNQATITIDNLEVAQFVYLLLNNQSIRNIINTITTKVVLILGSFTPERKTILDALREEIRKYDYLPVLFDFEKPTSRNLTETITTLARLAKFIIADLTDPSSIPFELQAIVPTLAIPILPILLEEKKEFAMFVDLLKTYDWVLPIHYYKDQSDLIATISEHVIAPAEQKVYDLQQRK